MYKHTPAPLLNFENNLPRIGAWEVQEGSPRKFLSVRRRYLIRGCEPIYMWASAQANKSGYIRETFRPTYNKILCGPGKQLGRGGNWEFPSRKCSASPSWGLFPAAWKRVAGARWGGAARPGRKIQAGPAGRRTKARAHLTPPGSPPHPPPPRTWVARHLAPRVRRPPSARVARHLASRASRLSRPPPAPNHLSPQATSCAPLPSAPAPARASGSPARRAAGGGGGRRLGRKVAGAARARPGPEGRARGVGEKGTHPPPPPAAPTLAWVLSNCSRSASRLWPGLRLSTRAGTLLMLFILPPSPPALPARLPLRATERVTAARPSLGTARPPHGARPPRPCAPPRPRPRPRPLARRSPGQGPPPPFQPLHTSAYPPGSSPFPATSAPHLVSPVYTGAGSGSLEKTWPQRI